MLETLFQRSHHLRRLRANPLGAILDQYVEYLFRRGHTTNVVHQFVRPAEHYGYWLGMRHTAVRADHVTRASAQHFLDHLPVCACPPGFPCKLISSRAAVNHVLRMLDIQNPAASRRRRLCTVHCSLSLTISCVGPAACPVTPAYTDYETHDSFWSDTSATPHQTPGACARPTSKTTSDAMPIT